MEDWGIDFGLKNKEKDDITKEIYHVTALVGQYATRQLYKVPRRTSEQTGHAWVQEILQGHPIRCYEMFRMEKNIFRMLCTELVEHGLKVTTRMGIEEMVAMFLNMIGHAQDVGYPTPIGYIGPYKCERYHLPDFRRSSSFANHNEVFNYYHSSLRKTETDSDFNLYESEYMVELDGDDDHGSVNPSVRLTVASSTEMDLFRDSIRDQIVEHVKLN
ncbi:hypothetical protein V6N13_121383 [Hibiscus sabdariffa]